jgi:hypothetical protein
MSQGKGSRIYCGREFSPSDIQTIRTLIEQNPALKRSPLSRQLCQLWGWTKPNGELKDMTCRVALLRMQTDGLITLPASRIQQVRRRAHFPPTQASDAQALLCRPVHELGRISIRPVVGSIASRLWNEYVQRYHYLGYTPLSGSQIRYNVYADDRLVALISFAASAWKLQARERFVGWDEAARQRNLQLVVNNARFLILPWIESKGLASKILSKAAKQLPTDWLQRYGYRPVLLETFVEFTRHRGTCYKAANWQYIGQTAGRGKKSQGGQTVPIKDIWMYPLRNDFATMLSR